MYHSFIARNVVPKCEQTDLELGKGSQTQGEEGVVRGPRGPPLLTILEIFYEKNTVKKMCFGSQMPFAGHFFQKG